MKKDAYDNQAFSNPVSLTTFEKTSFKSVLVVLQ